MRTFTRGLAAIATATAVALAPMSIANAQSSLSSSSSEPAPQVNQNPSSSPSPSPAPNAPADAEGEARLKNVLEDNLLGRGNALTPAGDRKAERWVQKAVNGEVYFTGTEWVKSISDPDGGVLVVRIPKDELNLYLSVIQGSFTGIRNGEAGTAVDSDREHFYGAQFYLY